MEDNAKIIKSETQRISRGNREFRRQLTYQIADDISILTKEIIEKMNRGEDVSPIDTYSLIHTAGQKVARRRVNIFHRIFRTHTWRVARGDFS